MNTKIVARMNCSVKNNVEIHAESVECLIEQLRIIARNLKETVVCFHNGKMIIVKGADY